MWETAEGIMATFVAAKTPAGDAALAEATDPNGKRKCLSAEFHATIKAGKAVAGNLWGAGLVERGAFPSAMVLASDARCSSAPPVMRAHCCCRSNGQPMRPSGGSAGYGQPLPSAPRWLRC